MRLFYGFIGSTLVLDCNCNPVCSSYNDQTAEQQTWQSFAAARHFCSAKILAGGLRWGWGPRRSRQRQPPAQRNFQRKFALRQVGSYKFVVPPTSSRSKVRNIARLGKSLYRAAPGCQRDRGPSVSGRVQRNPLPRGFLWATSSRRLDTALLCADKKRGVETYQAGRVLPVKPWRLPPRSAVKKPRCRTRQQKASAAGKQQKTHAYFAKNNKHYQRHQTSRRLSF